MSSHDDNDVGAPIQDLAFDSSQRMTPKTWTTTTTTPVTNMRQRIRLGSGGGGSGGNTSNGAGDAASMESTSSSASVKRRFFPTNLFGSGNKKQLLQDATTAASGT